MSPRVIQMPMSGGDRKHYVRELKWAQAEHVRVLDRAMDAYVVAHRLACEEWTIRQFIGGPADPSPTIGMALDAGWTMLKVECRACGHSCGVNLRDVIWPRKNEIHTLTKALRCAGCGVKRPNLVGLYDPTPEPPRRMARMKP